jgi:hypothetical protein
MTSISTPAASITPLSWSTHPGLSATIVEYEVHERVYQTDGDWRLVKEA